MDASVAIIAALAIERAPLDSLIAADPRSSIHVYQCGTGHERAYSAARSAISAGASALVSWGVAGALVPKLSPGTILLPQQVLTPNGLPASLAAWPTAADSMSAAIAPLACAA